MSESPIQHEIELVRRVAANYPERNIWLDGNDMAAISTVLSRLELLESAPVGLCAYLERQREWSKRTFGAGLRTKGILAHIRKELLEIEADPHDRMEWIDVIILALDGYWRHGGEPETILRELNEKQERNFKREWPTPTSEDEAVEHVRGIPVACNRVVCQIAGMHIGNCPGAKS